VGVNAYERLTKNTAPTDEDKAAPTENTQGTVPPAPTTNKGDELLKKIFFSGRPLPCVIEPNEFDSDSDPKNPEKP
jgi:hypothetical protein